jgi:hypothetical protein
MSNVVKFKQPPKAPKPKEPRKPNPGLRKALTLLGVAAALVLAWVFFQYVGGGTAPSN